MVGTGAAPGNPLLVLYVNTVYRGDTDSVALRRSAALHLLSQPGGAAPIAALATHLAVPCRHLPPGLLEPSHLASELDADGSFRVSSDRQSVQLNEHALLQSGKVAQGQLIERLYNREASPASWARHQLATYMVERQQSDMKAGDFFTASLDDAGACKSGFVPSAAPGS